MRKTIIYIAASLDGYVATKDGDVAWLGGDGSEPENMGSYDEFYERVDTVILGRTTYEQIVTDLSPEQWPYEGKMSYVMTHRAYEDKEGIHFTSEDIGALLGRLKAQEGKDIWICGGASVVNEVLRLSLADEICISVIPMILGSGIKLFKEGLPECKLELSGTRSYNGMVDLVYRPRK